MITMIEGTNNKFKKKIEFLFYKFKNIMNY